MKWMNEPGNQVRQVRKSQLTIVLMLSCLTLVGCSTARSNRMVDTEVESTGTALAFLSDKDFGRSLSKSERNKLTAAELKAFEFGQPGKPVKWGGVRERVSGSVIVTQTFRVGQSSCRRFSHNLVRGESSEQTNGTACRRQGGPWKLVQ
jgi:surface antigen